MFSAKPEKADSENHNDMVDFLKDSLGSRIFLFDINYYYLLDKAKRTIDEKQKYIDVMIRSEGKDLVKCLLTLNTIECQGYVAEIQLQAHKSFNHSFAAGMVGLTLIVASVSIALYSGFSGKGLDLAYITGISGLLTQFISIIFLHIYYQSLKRVDKFHDHLRQVQRDIVSIFISDMVKDSSLRDKLVVKEIEHLHEENINDQEREANTHT